MRKTRKMVPFSQKSAVQLHVLPDDDIEKIHEASLDILENTGIYVDCLEAADVFEQGGAIVTKYEDHALVKIPRAVVEMAISLLPEDRTLYGRTPEKDYAAVEGNVGFSTFGECVKAIDIETRQVVDCREVDLRNNVRICDSMDNIVVIGRSCGDLTKPAGIQALYNLKIMLEETQKPIFIGAMNRENCSKMIDMASAVSLDPDHFDDRPFVYFYVCPTSPLRLGIYDCEITMECARRGAGIAIIPMALAGATAPATLAGTIADHNAEVLANITLSQLTRPGSRCVYCNMTTMMDLRHAVAPTGCAEIMLVNAAVTQLARKYNLPSWLGGGISDSQVVDAQCGYEYGMSALMGALCGGNVVYGAGALESALTIDCAKLVLDCDAQLQIRRILQGVPVNDETLALDLIHEVGPCGSFLPTMHTANHMMEQSSVTVFNRANRAGWEKAGGLDATEAAYAKAKEIIATHVPPALSNAEEEVLLSIIKDREKELML